MTAYASALQLKDTERKQPKPIDKIIDEAIAAKPYKSEPLQIKPAKPRPQLHQPYDSRGSSGHRKAFIRMVGSE